ncbi:MerR family transcriptional regulator [Micromonospora endophytica]|uniref:MerR family transcriptional regulator n=1 Tax=Micromonospora endophytica TaxID=515350 RepID=UPI002017ED29|nr:MerR family transcriptional regulator [Micromonospora endophytica]
MTPLTPSTRTLGVGDVAVHSGVAPSAVRFYDNHGVIRAVRTSGNQRRFDESAACRIQVAKLAQRAGLTVREIADLFADLSDQPTPRSGVGSRNVWCPRSRNGYATSRRSWPRCSRGEAVRDRPERSGILSGLTSPYGEPRSSGHE